MEQLDERKIYFLKRKSKHLVKILKIKNGKRNEKDNMQDSILEVSTLNHLLKL